MRRSVSLPRANPGRLCRLCLLLMIAVLGIAGLADNPVRAAASAGLRHAFIDGGGAWVDLDLLGALRILQGDAGLGGAVRPQDPVTRAEFTALVLRLGGLGDQVAAFAAAPPPFADAGAIPAWAWGYVGAARNYGLVQGYDDGTFRPGNPVMLAEAVAMLTRLIGRAGDMRPGLAWPESYLELGERTGVSGKYSGYANLQLDRAGLAHLAAQALDVATGAGGNAPALLDLRYGRSSGLLKYVGQGTLTIDERQLQLGDPHLWMGEPPAGLHGEHVDILTLPTGPVAYVAPAGQARWSPDDHRGHLSSKVSDRLFGLDAWWQSQLAAEAAWALGQKTPGALSSSRVRLTLPATASVEAFGFVRIKGTTSGSRLVVRPGAGLPSLEVAVGADGSFDQLVYLPSARGSTEVELLTPVPGQEGWAYKDLTFAARNQLALRRDPGSGAVLLWPRAVVIEAPGFVDVILMGVPGERAFLRLEHDGRYQLSPVVVTSGMIATRLWLAQGSGGYRIELCLPTTQAGRYLLTGLSFTAHNTVGEVSEWLAPGSYVRSGDDQVRRLALEIAGEVREPYQQARSIYDWLGRHIAYDTSRAGQQTAEPLDTLAVLARREGVCQDYANAFAALCRALGVPARVVTGMAPWPDGEQHAWNEFWNGDRWVELDATWGAGYVRSGVFVSQPTAEWFDRDLSATHLRTGLQSDWRTLP